MLSAAIFVWPFKGQKHEISGPEIKISVLKPVHHIHVDIIYFSDRLGGSNSKILELW